MTNTEYLKHTGYRNRRQRHQRHPEVRILMGLLLVTFGIFWLMRRMQVPLPPWLFGWEMLLIGFGLIMGIRNRLNDISWLIPIAIGVTFLLDDVIPGVRAKQFIWPILVIGVGLVLMLRAGFNKRNLPANEEEDYLAPQPPDRQEQADSSAFANGAHADEATEAASNQLPETLDLVAVFGGLKRIVVSKNFKGGEIVAVMGGTEVDLSHADFEGEIRLEAVNVLGGTKLIIPAHWDVKSEMVAVFGGVEDKRRIQPNLIDKRKRLVLEGTCFLGGLEIRNY